ncbi:hypothetical protein M0802_013010 [Mischocyttarus mexicanus]|nr:hypothetical protein M0802_013010 [Mischocyttarus mexicanus]
MDKELDVPWQACTMLLLLLREKVDEDEVEDEDEDEEEEEEEEDVTLLPADTKGRDPWVERQEYLIVLEIHVLRFCRVKMMKENKKEIYIRKRKDIYGRERSVVVMVMVMVMVMVVVVGGGGTTTRAKEI